MTSITKTTLLIICTVLILTAVSCLERNEVITIDENGNTKISAQFKGEREDFDPPIAMPSENVWNVFDNSLTNPPKNIDDEFIYGAEMEIPYGSPIPSTFATENSPIKDINLHFPTEVNVWKEGNRTFYEFKRTYQARDFLTFNLSETELWDQELEEKVWESGIFNVTEEERELYLEQYGIGYGYLNWQLFSKTLGELVRQGDISVVIKDTLDKIMYSYLEDAVRPVRLLGIMGQPDDSIEIAHAAFEEEIHDFMLTKLIDVIGKDKTRIHKRGIRIFEKLQQEYAVTQSLDDNTFAITLNMPGYIIDTNGMIDFDDAGKVEWEFSGKHLHDVNKPLYALSVVEHE